MVRAPDFAFPAYSKPTKPSPPGRPRAAYEKIASDLAYELGLRVPPVLLYRRDPCPSDEEEHCCVSLIMYSRIYNLAQVHRLPDPHVSRIDTALREGSGIVAFDAWIGNRDRDNRKNTLVAVDPEDSSLLRAVFIDHANAFNFRNAWTGGRWRDVAFPPMIDRLRNAVDKHLVLDTVDAIEGMSETLVEEIVGRIPDEYVEGSHREVVLRGLLERRRLVRRVIERHV